MMADGTAGPYARWEKSAAKIAGGPPLFDAYHTEWRKGGCPPMDFNHLERMLFGHGTDTNTHWPCVGREIAELVRGLEIVRDTICPHRESLRNLARLGKIDGCLSILLALDDPSDVIAWLHELLPPTPTSHREYALRELIEEVARRSGREQMRQELPALWRSNHLLEEEKESLVRSSLRAGVFEWATLPLLAPEAQEIARRLVIRDDIEIRDLGMVDGELTPSIGGTTPCPDHVRQAVGSLLERVGILGNLAGARLKPDELLRLELSNAHPVLFLAALGRLRHRFPHPFFEEMFHFWRHDWPSSVFANISSLTIGPGARTLGIPLVRILHMRLVLDMPALAASIAQPEVSMVPEVLLHLLGREGVIYAPEVRLAAGSERGWRRRWVESTGEAMSAIFLEDALALDLTTLARIPESDEETPDFQARTYPGEHIVFESKGATSWGTFRKSKRKALKQLHKTGAPRAWQQDLATRHGPTGRSFACSFFAASDGDAESTQFHVEDPPFAFGHLFGEVWETNARRRHYAGVLQAAGMFEEATAIVQGQITESSASPAEHFRLELGPNVSKEFIGRYLRPAHVARVLGHPNPAAFSTLRVFSGIEADLLDVIRRKRFPSGRPFGFQNSNKQEASLIPPFGLLPDADTTRPRGVYSRMADGAFLAIELE